MTMVVHQTLHGYSDGHRLISGSLSLSSAEARIMVVMSDLSGPGVRPESTGYLTGYPLESAGKYVLARTWAAQEMPRPGCVWTHSLILDNPDLAAMTSAKDLLSAFRRPSGAPIRSDYSTPIPIATVSSSRHFIQFDRARGVMSALYTAPEQAVVAEAMQPDEDEQLATAIWMQQWPRLRRGFGFCTLAGADRSSKGAILDLQFVRTSDRQARLKFPNSVTPTEGATEAALELLIEDLAGLDETKIYEFLRKTGGDVDGGRRAMLPLCKLHSSLFSNGQPDLHASVVALASLDVLGPNQARSIRPVIAQKALQNIDSVDEYVFDYVVQTFEQGLHLNEQPVLVERLGSALWRRSPPRFLAAIESGGIIGEASFRALPLIPEIEIIDGLRTHPKLGSWIASLRPSLLESSDFWEISDIEESIVITLDAVDLGKVALALVKAGRFETADFVIGQAEPDAIAAALSLKVTKSVLDAWVRALLRNPDKAAGVLASEKIESRAVICEIARAGGPDLIPNDYGEDPWLIALRRATTSVNQDDEDFLAAFVMNRALGHRSQSQADLIRLAYTTLHTALQEDRLALKVKLLATARLNSNGWFNWDNCWRLRETVVTHFIDRQMDPETFGRLTDDGPLAISLIDEAARSSRGRRFLGEVRKRLVNAQEKGIRARADYIAAKIK